MDYDLDFDIEYSTGIEVGGQIDSIKQNQYYQYPLFEMYAYATRFSHLKTDEEIKKYFCSAFIPFIRTLPKVESTLKFKGTLRISWAFDIK